MKNLHQYLIGSVGLVYLTCMTAAIERLSTLDKPSSNIRGGLSKRSLDTTGTSVSWGTGPHASCDFSCPANSTPKPSRMCLRSMWDCLCNDGYHRSADACVPAPPDICSQGFLDMLELKVHDVDYWRQTAEDTTTPYTQDERFQYLNEANLALEEAYEDAALVQKMCFNETGDAMTTDPFTRHLMQQRRLFWWAIIEAIKTVAQKIVTTVVAVVQFVVTVVVEVVECAVGIMDDVKCGSIGCAFGLIGTALDVAIAVYSRGESLQVTVGCAAVEVHDEMNPDTSNVDLYLNHRSEIRVLRMVGGTICSINERLRSSFLGDVCHLYLQGEEKVDDFEETFLGEIANSPIVGRFIDALKDAVCGSPASSVLDLVEEVVACFIGCAVQDNVFCPSDIIPVTETISLAPEAGQGFWDYVIDKDNGDLYAIKRSHTGTDTTELHVIDAATNYRTFKLQTGTALHITNDDDTWEFALSDNKDLYAIKRQNTDSGTMEVHVLDSATNYQTFQTHTATALHEAPASLMSFELGNSGDVFGIKKTETGSGMTEVFILDAGQNYQVFNLKTATALHQCDDPNQFDFKVGQHNDVFAMKKYGGSSNNFEVHVLDAAQDYSSFKLHETTPLSTVEDPNQWDFELGKHDDLYAIKKYSSDSGKVEVHVLDSATAYQTFQKNVATLLPTNYV